MKLHVGTSGYSYKEWKGKFYPAKLPVAKMLQFYSTCFKAVEINSTFRMLPQPGTVRSWMEQVPGKFKFALKAPQQITHLRRLKNVREPLAALISLSTELSHHAGPLLFQLPPNFKKDLPRLEDFLAQVPANCHAAFEFRHQSWFDDHVFNALGKYKAALCVSDEIPELQIPFVATAGWGYLRMRQCKYSPAKLKRMLDNIEKQKWREAFVFFKHEDEATGPKLAAKFLVIAEKNAATR